MSDLENGYYWVKPKDREPVILEKKNNEWYRMGDDEFPNISFYEVLGKVSEWISDEKPK